MPRKRSRPKTEENFQNAVLELVARDGCGGLGINAVAQQAGADKVLIYRYFGDFKGLLESVAQSRQWLPSAGEIYDSLSGGEMDPLTTLRKIQEKLLHAIRRDACTLQLVRWRRANVCPLCLRFTQEWQNIWKTLPAILSREISSEQGRRWSQACSLLALIIDAELCNEAVDRQCLGHIAKGLEGVQTKHTSDTAFQVEESLPTNLL